MRTRSLSVMASGETRMKQVSSQTCLSASPRPGRKHRIARGRDDARDVERLAKAGVGYGGVGIALAVAIGRAQVLGADELDREDADVLRADANVAADENAVEVDGVAVRRDEAGEDGADRLADEGGDERQAEVVSAEPRPGRTSSRRAS